MISHKYKCIFIHIQRTAGSSIEKWICDDDWWFIDKSTKHMLASQTKELYKEYWDDYFKFSFVRNPWNRMGSMFLNTEYYNISTNGSGIIDISKYKEKWGFPILVENDYRFSKREDVTNDRHIENQVYGNILDEELDFIGKFENLQQDIQFIKDKLNIANDFNFHLMKSDNSKNYTEYYDDKTKEEVYNLYKNDIVKYNYDFDR
jgi:hypothetical protein